MSFQTFLTETGFEQSKPVSRRAYNERQIQAGIDLIENKANRNPWGHKADLMEAVATTDFPNLLGVIVDRELLAQYGIVEPDFEAFTKMGTVSNFNQGTRDRRNGGRGVLRQVDENGQYLITPSSSTHYTRQVFKRGEKFEITWESLVNDGMNAFADVAEDYAKMAVNTDHAEVTGLYADAAGPNVLLYGDTITDVDGIAITNKGTLTLTPSNLQTTLGLMSLQEDVNGKPLSIRGIHVVVPITLEDTLWQILNSSQWQYLAAPVEDTTSVIAPFATNSPIPRKGLVPHVDMWLPQIDVSGNVNTTWYVFADTGFGYAIGLDHLLGHEGPEICMKASDKAAVGGGLLDVMGGDFGSDGVHYRVRVVLGGNYLDPRMTYAQVG